MGSLSISSVMIIRIQSVHAQCVALFTAHARRKNITGPLENYLDMCSKPQSERVSVKMKLTHKTNLFSVEDQSPSGYDYYLVGLSAQLQNVI